MTDVPIWPGVAEYLYQAASLALVMRLGTWIEPSLLSPRCSSFDVTPIAGMDTDTGGDWCSAGPFAPSGPTRPAADSAGDGACCCASNATRMATTPPKTREPPASPASLTRPRPRGGGWGANSLSGHDMTTRRPAIRGQPPIWRAFPYAYRTTCYSRSLMFRWKTRHCPPVPCMGADQYGCPRGRLAVREMRWSAPPGG